MSSSKKIESGHSVFSNIRLICDARFPHKVAQIMPGEYYISKTPIVIYAVLGSFFSVCVCDPVAGIGGMNHFMAPVWTQTDPKTIHEITLHKSRDEITRLVEEVIGQGGDKKRLEIKLFGGAHLENLEKPEAEPISEWVMKYFNDKGYPLVKSDVGDIYPRKIYFQTDNGRVLMKKITRIRNKTIWVREEQFRKKQGQDARVQLSVSGQSEASQCKR